MLWADITDQIPKDLPTELPPGSGPTLAAIGAVLAAGLVLVVLSRMFRRKVAHPDLQSGLRENLGEYPPPPAAGGPRRLSVEGIAARVRLVVLAPAGNQADPIEASAAEAILDQVLHGLGAVARVDKPRVRVWPPQLSAAGFAPTFHRVVSKPDADGKPSRWVLLAGPAKAGQRAVLLGLALWADEENSVGRLNLEPAQWRDYLKADRTEA
jgi:hypothetical protein